MKRGDIADAIRQAVPAVAAARAIGLNPDMNGFCKCPIHGEKTASMKLYPGSRGWYCFGCHRGGSVIDLVMDYYGIDFQDAMAFLNEEFNLGLPIGKEATREQEEEARRRAAEREAERKQREEAEREREQAFLRICDLGAEIARMERNLKDFAPKSPEEEWDPRFREALTKLPELKDEVEDLSLTAYGKEEG